MNTKEDMRTEYGGQTVVIKYGGAAMQSDELKRSVMEDVVLLSGAGVHIVIVHGGGPELSALQRRLGIEPRFVEGLRCTDEETIDLAVMALCGKVNKRLVRLLEDMGGKAVGLSGIDGGIIRCEKKTDPDLGFVGDVTEVDSGLLQVVLNAGYIPVVSTIGLGGDGNVYNINADTAAGCIASALGADRLLVMTDAPGVLRDVDDPASVLPVIHVDEIENLIATGVISGGMIPKMHGLSEAVCAGIGAASVIDGREPHILRHLFSTSAENRESVGTTIIR